MKQSKDKSIVVTTEGEGLHAENGPRLTNWRDAAFEQASVSNRRKAIIRRLLRERVRVREHVDHIAKIVGRKK